MQDFEMRVRKWHSCDPFQLFDARIETYIDDVSACPLALPSPPELCLVYDRNSNQSPKTSKRKPGVPTSS